jgi:glycosyltransferase involved in cell wall biosynthesis
MQIALVHDWLTGMRGGEKCLEALVRLWPNAHVYTLIHRPGHVSEAIERMQIRTSFLQHVPGIFKAYRYFLPLMPAAIERFRFEGYDLVISLSHCVAKSVNPPPGVPHFCYCFTPMRYAWHQRVAYAACDEERQRRGVSSVPSLITGSIRNLLLADLRRWDRLTSERVTRFIAISRTVRQRILECYGRESTVICPPVDVEFFTPGEVAREDFYLCVSALVPYKRLEVAIRACNKLGRRLHIVGAGPELPKLRGIAGQNVRFFGWQSDPEIRDQYRRCRALLFPGEEDFGIVPLEAQACSTPVIALAAGGALETVVASTTVQQGTGIFFQHPNSSSLSDAILRFESGSIRMNAAMARSNAELFHPDRFTSQIREFVQSQVVEQSRIYRAAA